MPTGQPWQKDDRKVSSAEDRYLMTVIATASNPRFSVSRVDIDRDGPTYTIDTLRDLRAERGADAELFFITGADALAQILSWQDAARLFELAHFVGVTRPGHHAGRRGAAGRQVSLIEVPALAISSTECRAAGRRRRAGLVSGAGRRGAVHRQAWPVLQRGRDRLRAPGRRHSGRVMPPLQRRRLLGPPGPEPARRGRRPGHAAGAIRPGPCGRAAPGEEHPWG